MLRKIIFTVLVLMSICFSGQIYADDFRNEKERLKVEHSRLILEAVKSESSHRKSLSSLCFNGSIPSEPRKPYYSVTLNQYDESATLTFWREPCTDGTGLALLVKATPENGHPFLCSVDIKVIQNNIQHEVFMRPSLQNYSSWCDDLLTSPTLVITPYSFDDFDASKALTITYNSDTPIIIDLPDAGHFKKRIAGAVNGFARFTYTCKNNKTQVVKTFKSQNIADWSCDKLPVKFADVVEVTITGVVK